MFFLIFTKILLFANVAMYKLQLRRLSSSAASHAANDTIQELEEFKKKSASEIDLLKSDVEAKARALREADRTNIKLQEEVSRLQ